MQTKKPEVALNAVAPNTVRATLSVADHRRDLLGLTYVYPVLSRRAGGVSIGINVNINNACNWRCVYCQVPDLARGGPPPIDYSRLREELLWVFEDVQRGDFFQRYAVPEAQRRICDIAISGNGEPTSVRDFAQLVDEVAEVAYAAGVWPGIRFVVISNGSLVHRPSVQRGLQALARHGGELWFKLDRATPQGFAAMHHAATRVARHLDHLRQAAALCPTWVQTCLFAWHDQRPDDAELAAYLQALRQIHADTPLRGVMLYSLARPSQQPEAAQLRACPEALLQHWARAVAELGLIVQVTP